ncbi:TlpA family protein disulfide reductase [Spirillospora sp. NPDC127200]
MKKISLVLAAAALALAACGGGSEDPAPATAAAPQSSASGEPAESGEPTKEAPAKGVPAQLKFTAEKLGGGTFDGASLAGKPVVLWFWAPWCPKCQSEGPAVAKTAGKYGDKVAFVGVGGLDKSKEQMEKFVSRTGTSGLVQLDDRTGALYKHFKVTSQSSYVLLSPAGKTHEATGPLDEGELSALIDRHAL